MTLLKAELELLVIEVSVEASVVTSVKLLVIAVGVERKLCYVIVHCTKHWAQQ